MRKNAGFTLIETLITTIILAAGLTGVAGAFVYGIQTSIRTTQQTTAFVLLAHRMEVLKVSELRPPGRFSEYAGDQQALLTVWEVSSESPQRITVIVFGRQLGSNYRELARASMLVGPRF